MTRAIADLEGIRKALGVSSWIVLGHSWGSDLGVRYALEHPDVVSGVIGVAGRGPQRDKTWAEAYEAGRAREPAIDIAWEPAVHAALSASFNEWIHRPDLWRSIAECPVPMRLIAAANDIRPSWPLQQLAALLPHGAFSTVVDTPHDFWSTDPDTWRHTIEKACATL